MHEEICIQRHTRARARLRRWCSNDARDDDDDDDDGHEEDRRLESLRIHEYVGPA